MRHAALLLLMLLSAFVMAEGVNLEPVPDRAPTSRVFLLGFGRTNQLDTYLSPMDYKGMQISFLAQSERMTKLAKRHISFQSTFHGAFTSSDNPAETASYLGARLAYDAGWHYRAPFMELSLLPTILLRQPATWVLVWLMMQVGITIIRL